mmetsp:Transcript_19459/g.44727  ORF Transcript_19459/g.44727 Transcript_19459/m.44727 type:complete len:220 (-) Transcript_19459:1167-1826(-)
MCLTAASIDPCGADTLASSETSFFAMSRSAFQVNTLSFLSLYSSSMPAAGSICSTTGCRYLASDGTRCLLEESAIASSELLPRFHKRESSECPRDMRLPARLDAAAGRFLTTLACAAALSNAEHPKRFHSIQWRSRCSIPLTVAAKAVPFGPTPRSSSSHRCCNSSTCARCCSPRATAPLRSVVAVCKKMRIWTSMCRRKYGSRSCSPISLGDVRNFVK